MEEKWVLSLREQCQDAVVPFFFKQWGGVRKSEAGRLLDAKTYDEFPHQEPRINTLTDSQRKQLIESIASKLLAKGAA